MLKFRVILWILNDEVKYDVKKKSNFGEDFIMFCKLYIINNFIIFYYCDKYDYIYIYCGYDKF